jgi:hypothetical protein
MSRTIVPCILDLGIPIAATFSQPDKYHDDSVSMIIYCINDNRKGVCVSAASPTSIESFDVSTAPYRHTVSTHARMFHPCHCSSCEGTSHELSMHAFLLRESGRSHRSYRTSSHRPFKIVRIEVIKPIKSKRWPSTTRRFNCWSLCCGEEILSTSFVCGTVLKALFGCVEPDTTHFPSLWHYGLLSTFPTTHAHDGGKELLALR